MASPMEYLDTLGQAVIDLQRELVAIPALGPENGGQGELAKARFVKDYLTGLGLTDVIEINAPDERVESGIRPNLITVLPGEDTSRTLWVFSHLDVVPAGELDLWNSDPWTLKVEGDKLTGRGVEDNHQGIVSSLMAARAFIDNDIKPPFNLGLGFVADEETGSGHGLDYVLKDRPDLFGTNDLYLVPDFGNAESTMLEVAEKSMLWLKVTVTGKQCHASTPEQGINSLVAAADLILKVRTLYDRFNATDDLFNPAHSTFEPTRKDKNVENVNTIPGQDVFYIDCRVLAEYDLEDIKAAIMDLGSEVEKTHGVSISYDTVQYGQAAPGTAVDSDIVTRLSRAIKEVYGRDPVPTGIGGGTVAAFLRRRGLPAAVWSTCIHNAHQPNEYSHISMQLGDAKVITSMLLEG